jgi:ribosomal protein S18 acetylase RimI-like enzyme
MLKRLTNDGFDAVYEIMERSFPRNEIRSKSGQFALLKKDEYSLLAYENEGEIIGFISVWDLGEIAFVEHFAIDEKHRGRGVGSAMLGEVFTLYSAPIVLEVEPPTDEKTKKRIGFYERNGLVFHDYYYVQPSMEKGRYEVELKIMCSQVLDRENFEKVRAKLYAKIYKVKI